MFGYSYVMAVQERVPADLNESMQHTLVGDVSHNNVKGPMKALLHIANRSGMLQLQRPKLRTRLRDGQLL